jgi:hypothetical protein
VVNADTLDPLGDALGRFDWHSTECFVGSSEFLPRAIRQLVSATGPADAERLGELIQGAILSDGCLSEACLPVAHSLVVGLRTASADARATVLDLLAQIGSGFVYGPEREHVGRVDVAEIEKVVSLGFVDYHRILLGDFSYAERVSCIDLVVLSAQVKPEVRHKVIASLLELRAVPALEPARGLIDASVQELEL